MNNTVRQPHISNLSDMHRVSLEIQIAGFRLTEKVLVPGCKVLGSEMLGSEVLGRKVLG